MFGEQFNLTEIERGLREVLSEFSGATPATCTAATAVSVPA
jgi:hypothetical protein